MKKVKPATVLKALKMKKVAIQSFLKGLLPNASLKLIKISFKLPPIVLKVNGSNRGGCAEGCARSGYRAG